MYEIILKKKQKVTKPEGKDYVNTHKKDENGDDIWGYVTKPSYEVEEWIEVFKQQTEEVKLFDIVAAFNGVSFK